MFLIFSLGIFQDTVKEKNVLLLRNVEIPDIANTHCENVI